MDVFEIILRAVVGRKMGLFWLGSFICFWRLEEWFSSDIFGGLRAVHFWSSLLVDAWWWLGGEEDGDFW